MTTQRFGSIPTGTVLITADDISWQDFVPVFTGFSVDPVGEFRFCAFGQTVIVIVTMTPAGTSNATNFTMTLPFASNRSENTFGLSMFFVDGPGGPKGPGMLLLQSGSDVLELFTGPNSESWVASGNKRAQFTFFYERDFTSPTF